MKPSLICIKMAIVILSVCLIDISYGQTQIADPAKNTVFCEVGGNGVFYSLNYDRLFTPSFGFRIGYSYYSLSPTNASSTLTIHVIPLTVNYFYGSGNSKLELGLGMTYSPTSRFQIPGILTQEEIIVDTKITFFTAVIAYRYQPLNGGLNFRIGIVPSYGTLSTGSPDHTVFVSSNWHNVFEYYWPCISLGYTF